MELMGTNQRRALRRRRKLMPEPRRVSAPAEQVQDSKGVREPGVNEVPASSLTPDLDRLDPPGEDRSLVQN
ncbi:MAG: hypothetical protein EA415_00175 [Sphaerobacteraceae bacterium]|nr:MAG: hypothetical protein EA415_00175 [Sphaerobacteraceae bacterium]